MDREGVWQPPTIWPEQYPPLDGWTSDENGHWIPPTKGEADDSVDDEAVVPGARPVAESAPRESGLSHSSTRSQVREPESRTQAASERRERSKKKSSQPRSLQAEADIRVMLLVGGAIGVSLFLLVAALVLQSRAGATETGESEGKDVGTPELVFAVENEEARDERRREAAITAPAIALEQLSNLAITGDEVGNTIFNESLWQATVEDCLDITEQVLVERSAVPVVFADNFECVPSEGSWSDPYLGTEIMRTVDAEVRSLVPIENVHDSGGSEWSLSTREDFLNDTSFPASMVILSADSGHNPRNATPDVWRPSDPASLCGYAIDWIGVKSRWELTVSVDENAALTEMLATCSRVDSNGPHLGSMVIDSIEAPVIERIAE